MDRSAKAKQVADEYRRRCAAGEQCDDQKFIAAHSELMPELGQELRKLNIIERARRRAQTPSISTGFDPQRSEPPPPTEIPDYELLHLIGRGGFGQVWLCRNRHDGHFYAAKTIHKSNGIELEGVREYKKRAEANPYLVPIGHVGEAGEFYYYIMPLADDAKGSATLRSPEHYEPMTLERYLARQGRLAIDEVLAIARNLLLALEKLHEAGGIHRDVKPANILRTGGEWRLSDQGLMSDSEAQTSLCGTRAFWPPEADWDSTVDLYALGKTLFLLLTGAKLERFEEFRNGPLKIPPDGARGPRLREAILQACHDDRSQRFATAREMRRSIERIAEPPQDRERRPRRQIDESLRPDADSTLPKEKSKRSTDHHDEALHESAAGPSRTADDERTDMCAPTRVTDPHPRRGHTHSPAGRSVPGPKRAKPWIAWGGLVVTAVVIMGLSLLHRGMTASPGSDDPAPGRASSVSIPASGGQISWQVGDAPVISAPCFFEFLSLADQAVFQIASAPFGQEAEPSKLFLRVVTNAQTPEALVDRPLDVRLFIELADGTLLHSTPDYKAELVATRFQRGELEGNLTGKVLDIVADRYVEIRAQFRAVARADDR